MKRNQVTFYRSFYEAVMRLPKKQRLEMLLGIILYALDGVLPESMTMQQEGQFLLIKPIISKARNRAKCGAASGISAMGESPLCNNKKEIEKEKEIEVEADTEGFAAFWQRYPKKLGKAEALRAWVCVQQKKEEIMLGLEDWCNSESWHQQNGRFVPKPEKWLRERWWEQSPKQVIPCGASGRLGQAELEAISRILEE